MNELFILFQGDDGLQGDKGEKVCMSLSLDMKMTYLGRGGWWGAVLNIIISFVS